MDCFENSKSVIGSSAQRGTHPRAQWHTGTAPIGDARRAHRGSASELNYLALACQPAAVTHGAHGSRGSNERIVSAISTPLAGRRWIPATNLEGNGTWAQHPSVTPGARTRDSAAEIELAGSGGSKLPAHDTRPVGASRAMNRRIVSMNSKSLSGSRVHRGSYPRAQWHTGTSFIRNMRRARRGSAAGSN